MSTSEISVAVTGDLAMLVCDAVDSGEYPSHADVVRAALETWKDGRDQHLRYLREAWNEAVESEDDPREPEDILRQVRQRCGLPERVAADSR